jgi:hypothetical protein
MAAQPSPAQRPAGQYEPDQRPPGPNGKLVGIFFGLGVVGLLIGVGAFQLFGDSGSANTAAPQVTTTDGPASAAPSPSATPSAKPSATIPPNYTPIAENPTDKDLDFGFLTKVATSGGVVRLRFDRAVMLSGQAAVKANGGVAPDNDYFIVNENPALRTFEVSRKASVIGYFRLIKPSGTVERKPLTLVEFARTAASEASADNPIPVWLRHTDGGAKTGAVTAVMEQYLP